MALIKCPECGKEIFDKAANCPHCGFPIDSKKLIKGEKVSPYKTTAKNVNKRFAKFFVFDNCNVKTVKKAFRLAAEKLGKGVDDFYEKNVEPVLTIELEKWVNLMFYDSTKFKSKRTIASLSQLAKIEKDNTDISLPPLDKVSEMFKSAVKEIDASVNLFEESDYVDITKSYTQAHYQHIFDKEKELLEKDGDNVRTVEEEKDYKQSIGFDARKERKIRKVAQQKKEQKNQRFTNNKTSVASVISAVVFLAFFCLYQFGALDCSGGLGTHIQGVYEFDYHGYPQKVIISSNKTEGPCAYFANGERSQESYNYYKYNYNRPALVIHGCALIDVKNKMVYFSGDDFDACRNGVRCNIHK